MFIQCLSEDEDIVQINHHHAFGDEVFENSIHHSLESSQTIGQTKEHNKWFVETSVSSECSFPFITFFHPDIIEAPLDIEFSEVPSPLQFVNEFGDEGQWVFILHSDCIQGSVALHESEGTVFLLDKEYWR